MRPTFPSIFRSAVFFLWAATLCFWTAGASEYSEQLLLRPLPENAVLASFQFRSNGSSSSFDHQNFRYFPRSFGQILQHAHTKELHLRFSLGRWDAETWGERPWHGAREGGTGVELWAWVEADSDEEANSRWLTLTNALSGLFCASLNFIDSTRTIRPVLTFEPEGVHPKSSADTLHLLHGTLPHEVVCTENLTPFLKLLPCKGKAGISSLLDGHRLFDSSWQTMAIDVRPICLDDDSECILEIEQTVDMVLDIARSKRPRDNPIPRPPPVESIGCDASKIYHQEDSCYPLQDHSEQPWSISEVFGHSIRGSCSLGESDIYSEDVCLRVPAERNVEAKIGETVSTDSSIHGEGNLRCWKLPENGDSFDLSLPKQALNSSAPLTRPRLYAARSITGYGQERGGVHSVITNPSVSPVRIAYLESLPWYMKPYIHTLKAKTQLALPSRAPDPIKETYYRPALDRHRGTHVELLMEIPPLSTVTLTYDFEKAILRYTEYPPDANRGFDVAPAVIRLLDPDLTPEARAASARKGVYIRTTSLLLPLPTPDFSMPYNVIILTSTVMALGFGSFFNLLVRRLVALDELPPTALKRTGDRVKGRIQFLVSRFRRKDEKKE